MHRDFAMTSLALVCLVLSGASKLTASPQAVDPPAAPRVAPPIPSTVIGSPLPKDASSSGGAPSHGLQWAPDAPSDFLFLSRAEGDSQQPPGNLPSESPALDLIRFGGHLPKGGYDVRNGRHTKPASAPAVHG